MCLISRHPLCLFLLSVSQRESTDKQAALRQALAACEAARQEANELRRETAVAKEVATRLRDECASAKADGDRYKRQSELVRTYVWHVFVWAVSARAALAGVFPAAGLLGK